MQPAAMDPVTAIANAVSSVFGLFSGIQQNKAAAKELERQLGLSIYAAAEGRTDAIFQQKLARAGALEAKIRALEPPTQSDWLIGLAIALLFGAGIYTLTRKVT